MKAGLAAAMAAAVALKDVAGEIVVAAVCDEEAGALGTRALLAADARFDAAIVTEPTDLQVAIAHKGFVGFEIETRGRAAHGSRPDLGEDAILAMAPVLTELRELDARMQSGRRHELLGAGVAARLDHRGRPGVLVVSGPLPAHGRVPDAAGGRPGRSARRHRRARGRAAADHVRGRAVRELARQRDRAARAQPRRHVVRRHGLLGGLGAGRGGRHPDSALRPRGRGRARG